MLFFKKREVDRGLEYSIWFKLMIACDWIDVITTFSPFDRFTQRRITNGPIDFLD